MKTRRSKTPLSALSRISLSFLLSVSLPVLQAVAQPGEEGPSAFKAMGVVIPPPAPDRSATEGEGPFDRLVIDNVMLVNGLGAPPRGPVSIVVTGNGGVTSARRGRGARGRAAWPWRVGLAERSTARRVTQRGAGRVRRRNHDTL